MPTIFDYIGIIIKFYSNEHEPIHVHAIYNNAEVKITLHIKDNVVYRATYHEVKGKFSPSKMADLKKFVSINKNAMFYAWNQYFVHHLPIKPVTITKRIK